MSTVPLRIDTRLFKLARSEGVRSKRTPTAQIVFWAKLGRILDGVMSRDSRVALKKTVGVGDIDSLLARVNTSEGKARALAEIFRNNPHKQSKKSGRLPGKETKKQRHIARVKHLARKIFTTDQAVTEWLSTPAPALGGRAPMEIVGTDQGAQSVETVLNGIAYGNGM